MSMPPRRHRSQQMVTHLSLWTSSHTWGVSSAKTMGRRKISRLDLGKLVVHSPHSSPSGSQTSTVLRPRSASNVKSVLLYGSECWRVIKSYISKSFHNGCLRKICRIFWPNKISNRDLYRKTGCQSVVMEIKRRRIRWLGHVLRMDRARIPKVALCWKPPGKRKPGRPKTTWRRAVMAELSEVKFTWGEAQHAAQNRAKWKEIVAGLCPTGDEEE